VTGTVVLQTTSGTDGRYTLPAVDDGSYNLGATANGTYLPVYYPNVATNAAAQTIVVAHGSNLTLDQPLTPGYVLSGTLTSAATGVPVSGATVRVEGSGVLYQAISDAAGHYAVTGMVAGTRTVTVLAYGYTTWTSTAIIPTVAALSPALSVAATTAGIKGTISTTAPYAPIAGATVRLWLKGTAGIAATATTGADGRYTFPATPAGTYELDVVKTGYPSRWFGDVASRGSTVALTVTTSCPGNADPSSGPACALPADVHLPRS